MDKKQKREIERIKNLQKYGTKIFWVGWILWMLETTFYLALFGMHSKPANAGEKLCDDISGIIMLIGVICVGLSMLGLHKLIMDEIERDMEE